MENGEVVERGSRSKAFRESGSLDTISEPRGGGATAWRRILPPEARGSLHWGVLKFFGSLDMFIGFLESVSQIHGDRDGKIARFVGEYDAALKYKNINLNLVAWKAQVDPAYLLRMGIKAFTDLSRELIHGKIEKALPRILDAAELHAKNDYGFKDREMLLKVAGVLTDTPAVSVNVQNNQNVINATALQQFRETVNAIELDVRQEADTIEAGSSVEDNQRALPPASELAVDAVDAIADCGNERVIRPVYPPAHARGGSLGIMRIDPVQD